MSSNKPTCFVIQEFDDGGTFDKRYKDIIEPILNSLNVEPCRADKILGLNPIIEKIENAIKEADLCIAEISTDNPNVWFELGYALCLRKPTIMICDKSIKERLPFDIQHRPAIFYTGDSKSSFDKLEKQLSEYIEYELKSISKTVPSQTPVEGLIDILKARMGTIDQLKKNLKVMCWETNKWVVYPLSKFSVRIENDCLIITNETFIHSVARLIYDTKFARDFTSKISLKGNYSAIALSAASFEDRVIYANVRDQNIDIKNKCEFEFSRKGNIIKFLTSTGKRLHLGYYNNARNDMEYYMSIDLNNDDQVIIYSWEVELGCEI